VSRSGTSSLFERHSARVSAYTLVQIVPGPHWPRTTIGRQGDTGPLGGARQRPDRNTSHDPQPAGGALTGPILVADDDRAILATVSDILTMEGYPVVTALNGAEALRQIEEARPALLLLDMRMPGLNGWDVVRTLRGRGIAVPVLVMTAAQDARRWAEQIGADGYLAKPFDLDDLLVAVERLLRA
jgi:CheY-like chemotaxis protein